MPDDSRVLVAILVLIALGLFLIGLAIPLYPEPLERWSGYEWREMTPEQRVYFTAGLTAGLWFGARAAHADTDASRAAVERFFAQVEALVVERPLADLVTKVERSYLVGPLEVPIVAVLVSPEPRNQP